MQNEFVVTSLFQIWKAKSFISERGKPSHLKGGAQVAEKIEASKHGSTETEEKSSN